MQKHKYYNYFNETHKYYLTKQRYMECQLITAINAAICLKELPIDSKSIEYERLVDLVCARHGSAINVELAYRYLRLKTFMVDFTWENVVKYLKKETINIRNPIEFGVREKFGHSILAIDCEDENNKRNYIHIGSGKSEPSPSIKEQKIRKVRVLNFNAAPNQWITWKNLLRYVRNFEYNRQLPKEFKVFMLDPWYIDRLLCNENVKWH